ncbi:hypothetical protein [Aquibacillus sediminis]|nr:hypothetical protein [Aquibacillus sediminis]
MRKLLVVLFLLLITTFSIIGYLDTSQPDNVQSPANNMEIVN